MSSLADSCSDVSQRDSVNTVLTVRRAIQVLRAFRADRMPLSNAEIVRRTALPKATVSRLTTTLLHRGFLRHVPGGREFELGTGPFSIGNAFIEGSPLLRRADPFLQELAERLDVSVALAIGDQLEMLVIGYHTSHGIATLGLGVGSLLPMGTTAIGRAWLWGLSHALRNELIAALQRNAGTQGPVVGQGIRESFAELESTGVCALLGEGHRYAYGIALPVRVGFKRVLMALSCGDADAEPDLATRKRIAPELRKGAGQFENLLANLDGQP